MTTSKDEIRSWLEEGQLLGATHMIVFCDDWDYLNFPVYVYEGQEAKQIMEDRMGKDPMLRIMECYSLAMDLATQLHEQRAWNFA
jgi:hypothetical protein